MSQVRRRFVDWGAEKLKFKCPSDGCEAETLVLLGVEEGSSAEDSPKLKRGKKRKAIVPVVSSDIDMGDMEDAYLDGDDIGVDEEADEEVEGEDDIVPVLVGDEVDVDVVGEVPGLDVDDGIVDEDFSEDLEAGGEVEEEFEEE